MTRTLSGFQKKEMEQSRTLWSVLFGKFNHSFLLSRAKSASWAGVFPGVVFLQEALRHCALSTVLGPGATEELKRQ